MYDSKPTGPLPATERWPVPPNFGEELSDSNTADLDRKLDYWKEGISDSMAIREEKLLANEVNQAIELSPYLGRNALRCETAHGRVTIRGEVNSFFQKQMATEAVRKLRGIEEIDNQLTVKDHSEADLETV